MEGSLGLVQFAWSSLCLFSKATATVLLYYILGFILHYNIIELRPIQSGPHNMTKPDTNKQTNQCR